MSTELTGEIIVGLLVLLVGGGFLYMFKQMLGSLSDKSDALEAKLDTMDKKFDAKFEAMDKKFDAKFDAMDKKFDAKLEAMDKKFDAKLEAMDKKFDAMDKKFEAQNEKIGDIAMDVALLVDRAGVRDRLAERYPSSRVEPEAAESQLEVGV